MKILIQTISLLSLSFVLHAQQFSMPSQVHKNLLYISPGYVGVFETTVASLMHRTTWVGINGNVSYQNFEIHSPLKNQSMALGVQARHEQIGATNSTELFFSYGHRIKMGASRLAFGVKGGFHSKSLGNIYLQDEANDPAFEISRNQLAPNFGFGVSYYSKEYFFGLSVPYLLNTITGSNGNTTVDFDLKSNNYMFTGGGKIKLNTHFNLEPVGIFMYSMLLKPSYSVLLNVNYKAMYTGGIGYRANEAIIFNGGYQINNQLSLMYSYDHNIGKIGPYSRGSHELGLLIYWGFNVNTVNPRDF